MALLPPVKWNVPSMSHAREVLAPWTTLFPCSGSCSCLLSLEVQGVLKIEYKNMLFVNYLVRSYGVYARKIICYHLEYGISNDKDRLQKMPKEEKMLMYYNNSKGSQGVLTLPGPHSSC